jgi:hypothetical protein
MKARRRLAALGEPVASDGEERRGEERRGEERRGECGGSTGFPVPQVAEGNF